MKKIVIPLVVFGIIVGAKFALDSFVDSQETTEKKTDQLREIEPVSIKLIRKEIPKKTQSVVTKVKPSKKSPPKFQQDNQAIAPSYEVPEQKEHEALTDAKGNIYPTNVTADGEYIVAYGDYIVGETRYIDDYRNGDKELRLPKPAPWPGGIVPYKIDGVSSYQAELIEKIGRDLKAKTKIQLVPYDKSKHRSYVAFKKGGQHCYAQVGYSVGESVVSLSEKCDYKEIYHELFHTLGFFHEQNRFDRDERIDIVWENIDEKFWTQFEKFSKKSFPDSLQNDKFSFQTFMLYPPTSFSNSSDYSIVTREGSPYSTFKLPTNLDFERLKKMYSNTLK